MVCHTSPSSLLHTCPPTCLLCLQRGGFPCDRAATCEAVLRKESLVASLYRNWRRLLELAGEWVPAAAAAAGARELTAGGLGVCSPSEPNSMASMHPCACQARGCCVLLLPPRPRLTAQAGAAALMGCRRTTPAPLHPPTRPAVQSATSCLAARGLEEGGRPISRVCLQVGGLQVAGSRGQGLRSTCPTRPAPY